MLGAKFQSKVVGEADRYSMVVLSGAVCHRLKIDGKRWEARVAGLICVSRRL
jgi:hypothetical protein